MNIPIRIRRRFRLSAWTHLFLRGDKIFPAFGKLYVESDVATERFRRRIGETWPQAIEGKAYTRLSWSFPKSRETKKVAVLIGAIGRFGNAVIQVTNSGYLAKLLGARRVLYFRFDESRESGFDIDEHLAFRQLRPLGARKTAPDVIWRTDAIYRGGLLFEPCDRPAQEIATALRGALGLGETELSTEGVLTIHLRGGDIFGPEPHRDYGQPPLSFFLRVMQSQPWRSITLVTEDDCNPCIEGISRWCEESHLPFKLTGQKSVKVAVAELGSARNVVLSSGTFGPAALFLYPLNRRIYFFGHTRHPLLCAAKGELSRVTDREGMYIRDVMSGNWTNSSTQRQLMTSYPQDYLDDIEALGSNL